MVLRSSPRYETELLDLPDGSFLELAWGANPPANPLAPVVIIINEEECSLRQSPSARALLSLAMKHQWRAVVMHFRGCGNVPNRHPRGYHAGDTADLYWLFSVLRQRYPQAPKVAVGLSVGGNVLLKLVIEQGGDGLDLAGAIAVSAPLDLASRSDALNLGHARRHQHHLLKCMRRKIESKQALEGFPVDFSHKQLEKLDTLWAFDNEVTAPLFGFSSATDYYRRASAGPMLDRIELPTLILHAQDDPFAPADMFMRMPLPSANVRIELAQNGGHLGFIEQSKGIPRSWMIQRVIQQIEDWFKLPEIKHLNPNNV